MHDVAVLDDVVLAFEPHLAGIARAGLAVVSHVIVVSDRLGADKATLEISVDDTRGLRGLGAARHGPGAHLLRPGGEESHKMKERIAGADQTVETGRLEANCGEIVLALIAR